MDYQEFGTDIAADVEEQGAVKQFVSNFRQKIIDHSSNYEHSWTQKLISSTNPNWSDFLNSKFLEFKISEETECLTNLQSLTAHMTMQMKEFKDGLWVNLPAAEKQARIGLIPGDIVNNMIKNMKLFVLETQINSERSERYSLNSFVQKFFSSNLSTSPDMVLSSGFFIVSRSNQ